MANAAFYSREYDNRELVPGHPAFFQRRARDSERARATCAGGEESSEFKRQNALFAGARCLMRLDQ